jgi:methionine aminopeptidase
LGRRIDMEENKYLPGAQIPEMNNNNYCNYYSCYEIKKLQEQNKKLIEAVKELIDRSILPLQVKSAHEAKEVREFIEQINKVLSIISEIEGE